MDITHLICHICDFNGVFLNNQNQLNEKHQHENSKSSQKYYYNGSVQTIV